MPSNILSDHPLGKVTTPFTVLVTGALVVVVLIDFLVVVVGLALVVVVVVESFEFRIRLANRASS